MPTFSTHFLEKHQFAAYDDVCMKCSGVAVYEVLCITMVGIYMHNEQSHHMQQVNSVHRGLTLCS